jgi:enoyl-CoA hydratase/carnithine racemase
MESRNGVGWIKLNRPNALNSLNTEMVAAMHQQLQEWKEEEQVALICVYGEGEKGLCAGGDMRAFYEVKEKGAQAYARQFFSTEYPLDYDIHHYPKPVVVYMNGIVMGGGVGLSIGASHRLVTETTKWAMPEMNIGFFPDVGASFFLNQMPGYIGSYLALTASVIKAEDALYAGAADYYIQSKDWNVLKQALEEKTWSPDSAKQELEELLKPFCISSAPSSMLFLQHERIHQHFQHQTIEEIVLSLKEASEQGDKWAEETRTTLLSKSPTSLKVTLRQLQEGRRKSLQECFDMEMNLAMNFMKCHDFYEGVRSVLVDKDRSPKWSPASLEEVTDEQVAAFFHFVPEIEQQSGKCLNDSK